MLRTVLFTWTLLLAVQPCTAQLRQGEAELLEQINSQVPAAEQLLEQVVAINSGTMNFAGVRRVGQVMALEFEKLGLQTQWIEGAEWNRAGHLIARSNGSGMHILLIGHLDTVFEEDSPFQDYELVAPHSARGPGTTDMKGGNVIMLMALRALHDGGYLQNCQVTVVLTGDEEKSGKPLQLARADLVDVARQADIAIGFEDGDGDPKTAVVARRGASRWRLEVTGTPAHSSQIFRDDIGRGAIFECARMLTAFEDSLRDEPYLSINPGAIVGGTEAELDGASSRGSAFGKANVIAATTHVTGDLRSLSIPQRQNAKEVMQNIVANASPHTHAQLTFDDGYPPMAPSEGNLYLLEQFSQASLDLGFGPVLAVDPARAGAADVAFAAEYVPMALDGVGLMGTGGHTVDELADLRTLPIQAKRVAVLLARLITSQGKN